MAHKDIDAKRAYEAAYKQSPEYKAHLREYMAKYRAANPDLKEKQREYNRAAYARKRGLL
jgi:hypothetical protein